MRTRKGRKEGLPRWYVERPPHVPGTEHFLRAFWELSSTRQFGQALGPIPWHRIVEYAHWIGLDDAMAHVLVAVVRDLDEAYLSDLRRQQRTDDASRREASRARRR